MVKHLAQLVKDAFTRFLELLIPLVLVRYRTSFDLLIIFVVEPTLLSRSYVDRTTTDLRLLELLTEKCIRKGGLCKRWSPYQFVDLCRRMQGHEVPSGTIIDRAGSTSTGVRLVLRGLVALYSVVKTNPPTPGSKHAKQLSPGVLSGSVEDVDNTENLCFEKLVYPGETFGHELLAKQNKVHERSYTAIAVTNAAFVSFDATEYEWINSSAEEDLDFETKMSFLGAAVCAWRVGGVHAIVWALTARKGGCV